VGMPENERPIAWPGVRRVRLWRDSAETLAAGADGIERVTECYEKYQLPLRPIEPRKCLPISRMYVLSKPHGATPDRITRLQGSQALEALMMFTYRHECLDVMDGATARFVRNLALLSHVPIFSVPWRQDFRQLEADTAMLEEHFLADEIGL